MAFLITLAIGPAPAPAQETNRVLLYTGTTGFRHSDAINNGRPVVQAALEDAGYTVDWEDCTGFGTAPGQCQNPDENPRVFSDANLANYDAILFLNASDFFSGTGGNPGQLFGATNTTESTPQREAIIDFVRNGGGIAATHNMTDAGAGVTTWDWWDSNNGNSVVGSTMKGHAATNINNVAQVQVADRNHLSTRDLPSTYGFGDEHYNFSRSVRGDHHVLTTLDERTYTPVNPMGYDHPITWCKLYDGDNVNDATGEPKSYSDGRTWITGMGHFGSSYTENGGDNNLVKTIVGGVRWAAGEGLKSDCSGTVWSSFQRTILVPDANAPIGLDVAPDGKVYWSEIGTGGSYPNFTSTGSIMMHDPSGPAGNKTTVATIETRADHANSEDGVLGMALSPSFATDRHIFVYYSPRNPAWPTTGNEYTVGYNQISRFTVNAEGTAVVPGSERVILRTPKVKLAGNPTWCTGCPSGNGPGHVGGAGLDFDSEGNLYLGVGDDVSPNESGHNAYPPLDYRAQEHRDARKTSANTGDLRGKVVRIQPFLGEIPAGTEPGAGATYAIPEGNMFAPGTANARPEIYAMGFRQPFTLHTDPAQPGVVGVGEFCHDNSANDDDRAPAGTCEWNLLDEPGFQGWPFCVGNNSPANTTFRWDYQANASTNEQYDCSLDQIPSDLDYAPAGQTNPGPTNPGLANIPGPANPATVWKKYPGAANGQAALDFGDLGPGGQQPVAGPIYRFDESAGQNAFPRYYDGSWFILNRGGPGGFWKEVRRTDDGELLKVNDWIPDNAFGDPATSQVIGTQFGPDGALYAARFPVGCCRNNTTPESQVQIVKFDFSVQDECLEDLLPPNTSHEVEGQAFPGEEDTYINEATLRITANDQGCAGVDAIEYRVNSDSEDDWQEYSEPVPFGPGEYSVDYRATDRMGNTAEVATASFTVLEINDEDPPTVTAELAGSQDQRDFYVGSATLSLNADDGETGSGVQAVEYRVNSDSEDDWEAYSEPVDFTDRGPFEVDYRATDNVGNTSEVQTISFRVISDRGCVSTNGSDEFSGSALGAQWLRHTRNGGTPETGPKAPTLLDGQLHIPTHDFELDGSSGTTAVGPVNFVGVDLPSLGTDWEVETQFTIQHEGGWQNAGLIVWNGDNNYFRSSITHSLSGTGGQRLIYVEQSKDNPTSTEGARVQAGGNVPILTGQPPTPVTIRMRYIREAGADSLASQYMILAPESAATDGWQNFPATNSGWISSGGLDLNPAGGPRRDAEGSRVGIIAGSNFPGSTGNFPYGGTDAVAHVDYFRITPDEYVCEEDAPVTTASLDPADPGPGGTYDGPVDVTLSAADGGEEDDSGVDFTEYRIDGGEWERSDNGGAAEPFDTAFSVSSAGDHLVEFRSTDLAGTTEAIKSVEFAIEPGACVPERSDEFDGTALDTDRWSFMHPTTPASGPGSPSVSDGQLNLPLGSFSLDLERPGPIGFLGQPLPEGDFTLTTEVAAPGLDSDATGQGSQFAQVGLKLYQTDGDWVKIAHTRNAGGSPPGSAPTYLEMTYEDGGTRTLGDRSPEQPAPAPTVWFRVTRTGDQLSADYSLTDPDEGATWTPLTFGGGSTTSVGLDTVFNPADGPVHIGPYGGNGSITAHYDYMRFEPDEDVCQPGGSCLHSDEFDGAAIDPERWTIIRSGADGEPSLDGGQLVLPVAHGDINGGSTGPITYVAQPAVEGAWEATTSVTMEHTNQWQHGGLLLWTDDDNYTKFAWTRSSSNRFLEFHTETGGPREWHGDNIPDPGDWPDTMHLRLVADPAEDALHAFYSTDGETWTEMGGTAPLRTEGAHLGVNAMGDEGSGQIDARFDYFRFDPDECDEEDTEAPTTTATLDPAEPGPGGTYNEPVSVILAATDNEGGSGVEDTFYRVDGGAWQPYNLLMPPTISAPGAHTVEYYSVDAAGNEEDPPGSVDFTIAGDGEDTTDPVTEASTDPPGPGPHDGPVEVTLSASDPDEPGGGEPQTHEVVGEGFSWIPNQVDAAVGDTVNWDFGGGFHDICLGDDLPGSVTGGTCDPADETLGDADDGDTGGSRVLTEPDVGQPFTYYCTYHYPSMTGDLDVVEGGGGDPVPGSGVASITYAIDGGEPVTVPNDGDEDPFETTFEVSEPGEHTVTYFATDAAGNPESQKTLEFEITDDGGGAELDLSVKPRKETVKGRQKATFTATLANMGDEAASDVELCAKAPKRLVELKGKQCAASSSLEPEADMAPEFTFKPTRKARGKTVEITFTGTSADADTVTQTAKLKVKKKR